MGRIVAAHGVRGEVKIQPLTDFPERFRRGARLWLGGEEMRVEFSRAIGRLFYVKFAGINDRDSADELREAELQVPEAKRLPGDDVFYWHDIVGLAAETEAGEQLGKVDSVFSTGSNDVYVVRGERGELLLPAVDDVIKQIDLSSGRIVVDLLPGLEFTSTTPRAPKTKPPPRRRRGPRPATQPSAPAPTSEDS